MNLKNESGALIEAFNILKAKTTDEEFEEVLIMATQDIMFNRVGFNKVTSAKEVIDICERSFKLLRKDEVMWKKLCVNCGYSVWSLNYSTECKQCGGQVKCTTTA